MDDIIQLKITLHWTKPPIWRRVLVDRKTTFEKLHHIIQIAMGWHNYHLYEFTVRKLRIGPDIDYEDAFMDDDEIMVDSTVTLDSMITGPKEKFEYEYDFGDGWRHVISVEKFLPRDSKTSYPVCIDGALNCPPEDCGGVTGYYHLLDILGNKRHPERKEMLEWLGGEFDASFFDKENVNLTLSVLDLYIKEWKME